MISKLIEKSESETLEFKPSLSQVNEIVEAISGLTNARGGNILVGISNSGKVLGVKIGKDTIERLTNKITTNTEPKIYPKISVEEINGKSIILIEVKEAIDKPVLAFGRAFNRIGKSTVRVSRDELERLILEKRKVYFDEQICEAGLEDVDERKVRWFLREARQERGLDISENLPIDEVLMRLNLTKDGKPTNAAILLFGKNPQKFFLQSEVKCIRFKGTGVTGPMIDLRVMEGNIIDQVKKSEEFIFEHIPLAAWIEDRKIQRQEKWLYPPKAIREALVNAIAHRDYESTSKVQVRIFDDRIEFWNPGNLPEGWTVEKLKEKHESKPKNPLLAKQFFWIKYIEEVGTGTNKIIEWCANHGLPEPDFEFTGTSIVVTFRKHALTEEYLDSLGLNERQRKAVEYVGKYGKITNREYQKLNEVSNKTAYQDLSSLIKKQIFEKKGTGKYIYYILRVTQGNEEVTRDKIG